MNLAEFTQVLAAQKEFDPSEATEDEATSVRLMTDAAHIARQCGFAPALEDLTHPHLRKAWIDAGVRYDVEQAVRTGSAAHGQEGLARTLAEIDGGESLGNLIAHLHAAQVAASLTGVARG